MLALFFVGALLLHSGKTTPSAEISLAIISGGALVIERSLEVSWSLIDMTKGSWWPLTVVGTQINERVSSFGSFAKPYFDGVAYHPYTYPDLPSSDSKKPGWTRMLSARKIMVANGDAAKKIWVTEYGAPTGGPGSVSQAQQAALMHEAYRLWASYSWGGPLCWFDYRDKGGNTSDHGNFFGLYTKDGQPKLALQQYETLVRAVS